MIECGIFLYSCVRFRTAIIAMRRFRTVHAALCVVIKHVGCKFVFKRGIFLCSRVRFRTVCAFAMRRFRTVHTAFCVVIKHVGRKLVPKRAYVPIDVSIPARTSMRSKSLFYTSRGGDSRFIRMLMDGFLFGTRNKANYRHTTST